MLRGRPREHDREQIAIDLVEWAKLDTSLNFCGFTSTRNIPPQKLSLWSLEDEDFRDAYEIAKCWIGDRRDKMLSAKLLGPDTYKMNAHVYDPFMKMEDRERSEHQSALRIKEMETAIKLKQLEQSQVSEEVNKGMDAILDQISSLQESSKVDRSKNKIDK